MLIKLFSAKLATLELSIKNLSVKSFQFEKSLFNDSRFEIIFSGGFRSFVNRLGENTISGVLQCEMRASEIENLCYEFYLRAPALRPNVKNLPSPATVIYTNDFVSIEIFGSQISTDAQHLFEIVERSFKTVTLRLSSHLTPTCNYDWLLKCAKLSSSQRTEASMYFCQEAFVFSYCQDTSALSHWRSENEPKLLRLVNRNEEHQILTALEFLELYASRGTSRGSSLANQHFDI